MENIIIIIIMAKNCTGVSYPRKYVENMSLAEAHKVEREYQKRRRDLRRDPRLVLLDGDEIRHVIKKTRDNERSVWKAKVQKDGEVGTINFIFHELICARLCLFAQSHYRQIRPSRTSNCNAWSECEILRGGKWQTMEFLPLINILGHN